MKISTNKSTVQNDSAIETKQATISINPVVAHVLSRDLYSFPIESMFREIVINAIDAHTEANQTRPIEIHLPTLMDETFFVRDYGRSMNHEFLMSTYLNYGGSDRRDSNDVHGGFGLGTKSPMCYTTTFSVSSYIAGIKRDYVIFYDEEGLPAVSYLGEESTEEPDGLKVSLTTRNSSDYREFEKAAKKILKRIPRSHYTIENQANTLILHEDLVLEKSETFGDISLYPGSGLYINMGFYSSPFPIDELKEYLASKCVTLQIGDWDHPADKVIGQLTSYRRVEVNAKIGDYPFHPSRERINVTPSAVKKLMGHLGDSLSFMMQSPGKDLETDILHYRLTGLVPEHLDEEISIRAKFIQQPAWSYQVVRIPSPINLYSDFVRTLSAAKVKYKVAWLSGENFTAYVGAGRSSFKFPPWFPTDTALLVVESSSATGKQHLRLKELLQNKDTIDVKAEVDKYIMDEEARRKTAPIVPFYKHTRVSNPLLKDPKHNVLLLKAMHNGTSKHSWESTKHNVESLKALETKYKKVFWVQTMRGSIPKNGKEKDLLNTFEEIRSYTPAWRLPIIIGLPASKGTKTIEKAFPNVLELEKWIDEFYASSYFTKRSKIKAAAFETGSLRHLDLVRQYGPAAWLIRLRKLGEKINYNFDQRHGDKSKEVRLATDKKLDVLTKFSITANHYLPQPNMENQIRDWSEQVAKLTNNHPTGAKNK